MLVAVLVAVLGLALVAVASRSGDGRTETAIALPLVAAVAVLEPLALVGVLGGVAAASLVLVALEARTLAFGRRLRAIAAAAGATVPLAVLGVASSLGTAVAYPELWLAGSVVPGVLAFDLRRQSLGRRTVLAVAGTGALLTLSLGGVLLDGLLADRTVAAWSVAQPTAVSGLAPSLLSTLVLGGLLAGVLVRWRYGIHVGPLSIPLLAVWTVESSAIPLTYVAAGGVAWIGLPWLRTYLPGRRLAAASGLLGAAVAGVVVSAGLPPAAGLPALLAGVLAAEDARLLRGHAGRDRSDAVAVAGCLYVVIALATAGAAGAVSAGSQRAAAALAIVGIVGTAAVIARRERDRPTEERLRAQERRWVP